MAPNRKRARIVASDISSISGLNPTAGVHAIGGVRVHDIGQGDCISVLDENREPFMQIDYGGRVDNPFASQMDRRVPVRSNSLLMLSHWDEDHWCSAVSSATAKAATWLVPRQITSPRAVMFSTTVPKLFCVPEALVGVPHCFSTANGDQIFWEKIAPAPPSHATDEDCNRTGIAFSVVKKGVKSDPSQVILLPGDAPYGAVGHFAHHLQAGHQLRGMVAYHHGARKNLTSRTRKLMHAWTPVSGNVDVVFSCAMNNSYGHPDMKFYAGLPYPKKVLLTTPLTRVVGLKYHDIIF